MKKLFYNLQFAIHKKNKGFTLIELLLFMGIFSILVLSLFQLLISIFDVQLESQSTSVIAQDGRFILNKLSYDINNANSIASPSAGMTAAKLIIINGSTTMTYQLNNGNLNLTDSTLGTTNQLNSTNSAISNLSFLRLSDTRAQNKNTITVSFTLTSRVVKRSGAPSENFKLTIGNR